MIKKLVIRNETYVECKIYHGERFRSFYFGFYHFNKMRPKFINLFDILSRISRQFFFIMIFIRTHHS